MFKSQLHKIAVVLLLTAAPAWAGSADKWSLAEVVPANAFVYIHAAENPENEFLSEYWNKVWETLKGTGLEDDVKNLILGLVPAEEGTQFAAAWDEGVRLIKAVEWRTLAEKEFIYAQQLPPLWQKGDNQVITPSYLWCFRMNAEHVEANVKGLVAILQAVAALDDKPAVEGELPQPAGPGAMELVESREGKVKVWKLDFPGAPVGLRMAQTGEVIVLSINMPGGLFRPAVQLLNGDKKTKRMIDRPDFRAAMKSLPKPENERFFMSMSGLLDQIDNGVIGAIEQEIKAHPQPAAEGAGEQPCEADAWIRMARRALDHLRFVDYFAATEVTEGLSTRVTGITRLSADAKDKPLYKVFCERKPVKDFDRFIPKSATSFSVSSGIDLLALYQTMVNFIRDDVPGGPGLLAQWDALQEQFNFHPDKDLFGWIEGEMISVTMPPIVPSPFGGSDSVLFIRVTDEEKAKAKLDGWIAKLGGLLTNTGQPLTTQPATSPTLEGFLSVTYPPMMMFLRPVYGVHDGYLVIGTNEQAIKRCLRTAKGEISSIRKNPRFAKEGLTPKGAVCSVSFTDKTKWHEEMAQALGMMGMVAGFMPQTEETKAIRPIFSMIQKLAPVVAKMDFYRSEASMTTFDGKEYRTVKVTNYKEPAPPEIEQPQEADEGVAAAGEH